MIIHDVEQGTDAWHLLRAGLPTASEFSRLITSTGLVSKSMSAYAMELAGDLHAGKKLNRWEGNKFTDRGHELEDEARAMYELLHDQDVTQVGFCTDDLELYGASPDGMIGEDGLVEIKCLPKRHIEMILHVHSKKKPPPEFVAQIQGQLMVTERSWCDLYFYQPSLPDKVIRVERDDKFIKSLGERITECLVERDRVRDLLGEI